MVGGNVYDSGFNGTYVPDKELFIRWLELSAFMPSIQVSDTTNRNWVLIYGYI